MTNNPGNPSGPPHLGLPEHSALTIEGRIERAAGVASHAVRRRDGHERPLSSSHWATGLLLVLLALAGVVALSVVVYLLG